MVRSHPTTKDGGLSRSRYRKIFIFLQYRKGINIKSKDKK